MPHSLAYEADYLREKAERDLLNLLECVRGKKDIVISKDLSGPLGLIVKFSTLQEYGVDRVFFLENKNVDSLQKNIVFIVHGENATQIQLTADIVRQLQTPDIKRDFSIFWTPRRTLLSNQILDDEGIIGDVNIAEFPLYFIPLDHDVWSLELEDCFKSLYLDQDPCAIHLAAIALMQIQTRHGLFPRILGKGNGARKLADQLLRMKRELDAEDITGITETSKRGLLVSASIENVIIVDRSVDFPTPLMTQLTYEGLVDEMYGVLHNQIDVDPDVLGADQPIQVPLGSPSVSQSTAKPKKVKLDSSDELFEKLRDTNFAVVGNTLNRVARRLDNDYQRRHAAKSTSELREFVNKLPAYQAEHKSLRIHTNLAENIMRHARSDAFRRPLEIEQNLAAGSDPSYQHEAIEELIFRNIPLTVVLRLLCLESCICGGLRPKALENFKRLILQAYGYQHLLTFDALEKMELLTARSTSTTSYLIPTTIVGGGEGTSSNYNHLRKALSLIIDEVDEQNPEDVAYVYSGYAPLSIRLVQCILQGPYLLALNKGTTPTIAESTPTAVPSRGWLGFEDTVKNVRGITFNIVQKSDEQIARARNALTGTTNDGSSGNGQMKTVFVFFLGGITFTEIAALRFIARQEAAKRRRRIIICTTNTINGNRMMEQVMEKKNFGRQAARE